MPLHSRVELLAALASSVRSATPQALTTAQDLRNFLTLLTDELLARTDEPTLSADMLAALAGTAGAPAADNAFVTDSDPRLGAASPSAGDDYEQVAAPIGSDYFYYVLAERYHLAETVGVRNVQAFAYQLVQGPNAYPVHPTLEGLNADLDQLTAADVRGGYTIGVQLQRADASQPAFARLRLRAA